MLKDVRHDVYHLPSYVALAARAEGGLARAYHAEIGGGRLLIPLLLRSLDGFLGAPANARDATSPYGYAGPVVTEGVSDADLVRALETFIEDGARAGLVTTFLRTHPLLRPVGTAWSSQRGVQVVRNGLTVSVDLTLDVDALDRHLPGEYRRNIAKLRAAGFQARFDEWDHYAEFQVAYARTMQRHQAGRQYQFDPDYFAQLRAGLGSRLHLCSVVTSEGDLACGGLFTQVDGIVQYHLSATADLHRPMAPSKLMLYEVRLWARERGAVVLHLGGGVGGQLDSLYAFKRRFGSHEHTFETVRVVHHQQAHAALMDQWLTANDEIRAPDDGYFPLYRARPTRHSEAKGPVSGPLYGLVRLVPEPELAEPLHVVFAKAFNGIADAPIQVGPCSIVAGHTVSAHGSFVASRREPLFWSPSRQEYRSAAAAPQADIHDLVAQLAVGDLIPAGDDCLVMHEARSGATYLCSSCAGASLLYVSEIPGFLLFATSIARFKRSREAPIDVLGLGEIVRFGAAYGRRTIVAGVEQVPYGHRLTLSRDGRRQVSPYVDCSYQPDERLAEAPTQARVERALGENLHAGAGEKHLMFSGGVDSCVLAAIGGRKTLRSGWFMSMGETDPEEPYAVELARRLDLELQIVRLDLSHHQMVDIVRSYATPMLDYSILPTHLLGQRIAATRGADVVVEGTGADSWFGHKMLGDAKQWGRLARLHPAAARVARGLYARLVAHDASPFVRPLKVLARLSSRGLAGLGYLCGSPLYASMLNLSAPEWLQVEDSVIGVWKGLVDGRSQDAVAQILTMEAMSAINMAASKTSQWNLSTSVGTLYPFLMPNTVAIGRTVPLEHLYSRGLAKPMLKRMLLERGVARESIYRTKTGFTPPLLQLLGDKRHGEDVRAAFEEPSELDDIFTPFGRSLHRRLLPLQGELTFHALGPLWAVFAVKTWVSGLRAGRLAVF
jgi:asparagine synthetase B (glutamine-hydrolysing)